jgi:hypothetical protein
MQYYSYMYSFVITFGAAYAQKRPGRGVCTVAGPLTVNSRMGSSDLRGIRAVQGRLKLGFAFFR